jgi:YfiH family protein
MSAGPAPNPAWILPDWIDAPRQVHALTTRRTGGVGVGAYTSFNLAQHVGDDPATVDENRRLLRTKAALPAEPLWLAQVHGTHVVEHPGQLPGTPPRADAAVALAPGRVCVVMTADCLPVVFTNRAGTRVGVAHAGWRGLAGGVLEATIAALRVPAHDLLAWLGPALSQPAFEVGPEVREAFVTKSPTHAAAFVPNARGRFQADLYALARATLARAGVGSVSGGGRCTYAEDREFYSYRRDGGATGRMATLAWLE